MVGNYFVRRYKKIVGTVKAFFYSPQIKAKSQSGFTLVEMLTVVSIMALIGSITLANTLEAKRSGEDTRSIQNTRSLLRAIEAYYLDHGYYPTLSSAQQEDSPGNKNSCGNKICLFSQNYSSTGVYSENTQCLSGSPCNCLGSTPEQRSAMGWISMLDGSLAPQDSYFSPRTTPRDPKDVTCNFLGGWENYYRYSANYSVQDGTSDFLIYYITHRIRANAVGKLLGCTVTTGNRAFCVYEVRGDTVKGIRY